MTLTKIQIVEAVQEELGLSKKKCGEIVETLLDLVKSSLEKGEDVLITGFGKFCVKEKSERKGVRNITTGEDLLFAEAILRVRQIL